MTTTPQAALKAARAYYAEHRDYARVVGLLEDQDAFLVLAEPLPEYDHPDFLLLGPGPVLISKATGEVDDLGSAAGGDPRWSAMTPVVLP
jgi:hypothetical protein